MALCSGSPGVRLPADDGTPAHSTPVCPAIRLAIDSFSFHRWFGEANQWELPLDARWTTSFDIGNAARVGEDPLEAAAATQPYCVMSHLCASRLSRARLGRKCACLPAALAFGAGAVNGEGHRPTSTTARFREKVTR